MVLVLAPQAYLPDEFKPKAEKPPPKDRKTSLINHKIPVISVQEEPQRTSGILNIIWYALSHTVTRIGQQEKLIPLNNQVMVSITLYTSWLTMRLKATSLICT